MLVSALPTFFIRISNALIEWAQSSESKVVSFCRSQTQERPIRPETKMKHSGNVDDYLHKTHNPTSSAKFTIMHSLQFVSKSLPSLFFFLLPWTQIFPSHGRNLISGELFGGVCWFVRTGSKIWCWSQLFSHTRSVSVGLWNVFWKEERFFVRLSVRSLMGWTHFFFSSDVHIPELHSRNRHQSCNFEVDVVIDAKNPVPTTMPVHAVFTAQDSRTYVSSVGSVVMTFEDLALPLPVSVWSLFL